MQRSGVNARLSRRRKAIIVIIIVDLFLIAFLLAFNYPMKTTSNEQFFLGVEIAYGNFDDLKSVVTEVKNYTNLIVLGLPEVSINRVMLDQSCEYIYQSGLNFIVLFTNTSQYNGWQNYTPAQWVSDAKAKYGEKFVAVYRWDEPGGDQLDNSRYQEVKSVSSYSDAASKYVSVLSPEIEYYKNAGVNVLTADYGLYWFDYKAGYETVLAEFGWNNSREKQIALARGAAHSHAKDWGAMITWTYDKEPYIESGTKLFDDMLLAYNNGAKYVVVFDYPKIESADYQGILKQEHFDALKQFWNYSSTYGPNNHDTKTAYVLPEDYGYGFRSASDTIWGIWNADSQAYKIYADVDLLIRQKGADFNIICDSSTVAIDAKGYYEQLIYWNGTRSTP